MQINTQYDGMDLFIKTLNKVENVDRLHQLEPHVFAVYRAYNTLDADIRGEKSFVEYIGEIALDIEDRIITLEGLTRFKVPNRAASACPIIPGLTIAKAAMFLLGLMPAASKYRRDCKTTVRNKQSTLEKLFGLDETSAEQPSETELQLAEAV